MDEVLNYSMNEMAEQILTAAAADIIHWILGISSWGRGF